MMNQKKVLWGLIPLLLIPLVSARDLLDIILRPFSGIDVGSIYLQYYAFIDAVIYLILFLSLAQMVFKKVYGGREGKLVSVAVGLALAFAMAVFELRTGFNLGKLAPLAALIFLAILVMLLFHVLKGLFDEAKPALCFTILITFGMLTTTFNSLYRWIEQTVPLLLALIHIALVAAFICALMSVIKLFKGNSSSSTPGPRGPPGPTGPEGPPRPVGPSEPTPKPPPGADSVTLISPAPGSHHPQGKAISIVFHVEGPQLSPPAKFDYEIILDTTPHYAYSKASGSDINPRKDIPGTLSVGPHKIFINTYLPGKKTNIARTGEQIFFIDSGTGKSGVKIKVPANNARFEEGKPIPLEFETTNINIPCTYRYIIRNAAANINSGNKNSANKDVFVPDINATKLTPGKYAILVEVIDPKTKKTYSDGITIEIIIKSGTNTVKILNPVGLKSPYPPGTPIPVEIEVAGPHHDAGKEYTYIIMVIDDEGKKIFAERGKETKKKFTHGKPIPGLVDGKYTIKVFTGDPITGKQISMPAQEIFVVKKKGGGGGGRGYAEYNIVLNGTKHASGVNFSTNLELSKIITFEIENSGTGGTLNWNIKHNPWIHVNPTSGSLKKGKKTKVTVAVNPTTYPKYKSPKQAQMQIEGKAGKRPLAKTYIVFNIK